MDKNEMLKTSVATAIKNFAEELKEHKCSYDLDKYHSFEAIDVDVIDDLLKEKLEGYDNTSNLLMLPCQVGDWVRGKTGNWCGTVEEFSYNSDGLFLFISCGGKYFYVRPDEVIFKGV